MFKNHLLITLRRLSRKKGYAILNVAGLALGLAVFGILMLFVRYEMSYERFHEKADRIELLIRESGSGPWRSSSYVVTMRYRDILESAVPEVEHVVRVQQQWIRDVRVDDTVLALTDIGGALVDREVFEVFTFPLIAGDPLRALDDPGSAVIDPNAAVQMFGSSDPLDVIGRTFEYEQESYTVTGLLEPVPPNTMWRPNILLSMETFLGRTDWRFDDPHFSAFLIYLLYRDTPNQEYLQKAVETMPEELNRGGDLVFHSQPVTEIHLRGYADSSDINTGQLGRLRVFALVSVLILLLAIVNYINLATAYGMQRAREVGVRKTLGASRAQIFNQALIESVVLSLAAAFFALWLMVLLLPVFNELVRTEIVLSWNVSTISFFVGIALGAGLLAGLYPAVSLSGARPNEAFRQGVSIGHGGSALRRVLVVFQFAVGIALVIASSIIVQQVSFMAKESGGIKADRLIELSLGNSPDVPREAIRQRLSREPALTDMFLAAWYPGSRNTAFDGYMRTDTPDSTQVMVQMMLMEPEAAQMMGMELVAGEWLTPDDLLGLTDDVYETLDTGDWRLVERGVRAPILINETAVRERGWTPEEAIGRGFPFEEGRRVAGVLRDFHYSSMRQEINSMRIEPIDESASRRASFLVVEFEEGNDQAAMDALQAVWQELVPDMPFQAEFLKDRFEGFYGAERRLAGLFWAFGIIAVIIACLGLFGLAAFTAERRVKEVGIRKVLGANTGSIVRLLSTDFAKLVIIAFVIAAPIAWWAMNRWLGDFAYHITLGPGIFLLAGFGALLVALATVSYHAIRAANADPVRSLRSE